MQRRSFIQRSLAASMLLSLNHRSPVDSRSANGTMVINSGVGGNNTIDLLARLESDCLVHKPGLTILMVGTNDMNSRKYIPLDAYAQNLTKIIRSILDAGSNLALMNLLPVYEPYLFTRHKPDFYLPEGHSGRLRRMNECIARTAAEFKISYLNLHHIFSKAGNVGLEQSSWIRNEANSNTMDGLHPTAEGYRVIGLAVYKHLVDHALIADKIVCLGDSITYGDGGEQSYPAWLNKLLN
jgi:lysophospholipase L1-like esterase